MNIGLIVLFTLGLLTLNMHTEPVHDHVLVADLTITAQQIVISTLQTKVFTFKRYKIPKERYSLWG